MSRPRLIALVAVFAVLAGLVGVVASGVLPYRLYVIHTGSMSPTIPSTSAVLVERHEFAVGDVVSFRTDDGIVTHRLTGVTADGRITTRGDANASDDPYTLTTSAIVGRVVASPPVVGYWLVFLKNPLGLATILLGSVLLWQIWSLAGTADDPKPARPAVRPHGRHRAVTT